jgi:hypothetical protein
MINEHGEAPKNLNRRPSRRCCEMRKVLPADFLSRGHSMAKRVSIGLALALTAVLTLGMIYAVQHSDSWRIMPYSTYRGLLGHLFASAIDTLGRNAFAEFYIRFVMLVFPLLGLGVFRLGSRRRIGKDIWKPVIIAVVFTAQLEGLVFVIFKLLGLGAATAEAARAIVVLGLMIWSIDFQVAAWFQRPLKVSAT